MSIITKKKELEELCQQIDHHGRFAMDLEFIPERTYTPELCLVQVATDDGPHIIDPLALPDLTMLWQRVDNPDILVVLHAAEQDLNLVYAASGLVPSNIIDTQIAAGFAGFGFPIGYGKLLHQLLGVSISKTESYTDWLNRPLTDSQIDYALDDVRHILPMYDKLAEQLHALNRFSWAEEECLHYCDPETYSKDHQLDFLRVKGASALNRRGLAVLRELYQWRDQEASQQNRPARSVVPDNIMLELGRRPPHQVKDIQRIRGVRPELLHVHGKKIIEAVERGLMVPDSECPSWPSFKVPPRHEVLLADMLFVVLKVLCYDMDLAPELVATRNDLQTLVKLHRDKKLKEAKLPLLHGWRQDLAGSTLLSLLDGSKLEMQLSLAEPPISMKIS